MAEEAAERAANRTANDLSTKMGDIALKVADESATKALSIYKEKSPLANPSSTGEQTQYGTQPQYNGLNIVDRKGVTVSQQDYERIVRDASNRFGENSNQMSFGQRFEQVLNNKFTDEVIGKMVGSVFGAGTPAAAAPKQHSGFVGAIYDVLNTKFAAELGMGIGQNITGLVKELGSDRIGRVIDSYTGKSSSESQQQLPAEQQISPEEQQKRSENALMSLDSNNLEHLNVFMQATKISNVSDAQKALLREQSRILQSRGLSISSENEYPTPTHERPRRASRSPPNDMNRQLIQQYDNMNQYQEFERERPATSGGQVNTENSFFGNTSPQPNLSVSSQQSQEEAILSLSPDDPVSIHTYMALKGISGVDQPIVRKMLIKEQDQLRKSMSTLSNVPESPIQNTTSNEDTGIDSSWTDHDGPRTIKKSDFYEEIGLNPKKEPELSKQQTSEQQIPNQRTPEQQTIEQQTSERQTTEHQTTEKQKYPSSGDVNNIAMLIEGLGNNFELNMKSINDNIRQLNDKISFLEDEVTTLKEKVPIEVAFHDIDYSSTTNEAIVTKENISDIIEKSPKIVSLNDITKDESRLDNIQTEGESNDSSTDFSDIGENKQEVQQNEDEGVENDSKTKNEADIVREVKPRTHRIFKRKSSQGTQQENSSES